MKCSIVLRMATVYYKASYVACRRCRTRFAGFGGDVHETDFGTREFATLDLDGNLLTFFHVRPRGDGQT